MTSGNLSDEPIAYRDAEALRAARRVADALPPPRPPDPHPHRRLGGCGRSPAATAADAAALARATSRHALAPGRGAGAAGPRLRRRAEEHLLPGARATAPGSATHIGDLENFETLRSFGEGIEHFERLFAVEPELVAHDLHPDYLSTRYALRARGTRRWSASSTTTPTSPPASPSTASSGPGARRDLRRHRVRRATARSGAARSCSATWRGFRAGGPPAAGAAARRRRGDPRAVADGLRLARAAPGGGRRAARGPRRRGRSAPTGATCLRLARGGARLAADQQRRAASSTPSAALCGVRRGVSYEGQAAIELEATGRPGRARRLPAAAGRGRGVLVLDPRRRCSRSLADLGAGVAPRRRRRPLPQRRRAGHRGRLCRARRAHGIDRSSSPAASSRTASCSSAPRALLEAAGLRSLVPERLPPNDGGISYGQAAVAAARSAPRRPRHGVPSKRCRFG